MCINIINLFSEAMEMLFVTMVIMLLPCVAGDIKVHKVSRNCTACEQIRGKLFGNNHAMCPEGMDTQIEALKAAVQQLNSIVQEQKQLTDSGWQCH